MSGSDLTQSLFFSSQLLGAILAFMLGIFQIPLEECEEMYRKLGADVFKQNLIVGTAKLSWSHAFYDSEIWETILKLVLKDSHADVKGTGAV